MCGFSGTNDNQWLLPFTVRAEAAEGADTQMTNGRNVATLLRPGKASYVCLHSDTASLAAQQGSSADETSEDGPGSELLASNRLVLDLVVREGLDALIDAGEPFSLAVSMRALRQAMQGTVRPRCRLRDSPEEPRRSRRA